MRPTREDPMRIVSQNKNVCLLFFPIAGLIHLNQNREGWERREGGSEDWSVQPAWVQNHGG